MINLGPSGDATGVTDPATLSAKITAPGEYLLEDGDWYFDRAALVTTGDARVKGCGTATRLHTVTGANTNILHVAAIGANNIAEVPGGILWGSDLNYEQSDVAIIGNVIAGAPGGTAQHSGIAISKRSRATASGLAISGNVINCGAGAFRHGLLLQGAVTDWAAAGNVVHNGPARESVAVMAGVSNGAVSGWMPNGVYVDPSCVNVRVS